MTLLRLVLLVAVLLAPGPARAAGQSGELVYIIPIRDDIMPPLKYLVRRGVKEAMEAKADVLVLDMETNGGRVDTTEEIISILDQFEGRTITYVNDKAFSAGAFIAVATQEIYMAPQSVIGAAAPVMMAPGGGVQDVPESYEAKMTSAVRALVRTSAEKNGHNIEVVEAMIDRDRELKIGGEVISAKGELLTLTNVQAEEEYGNPPEPLLSKGTFPTIDALLEHLGLGDARVVRIEPTGAEQLAGWLTKISPLLMLIGMVGVYIEMKTPGFGIPGILGISAFGLYFLGGYIAGLSGLEWAAVFLLGLVLVILELFIFPGTIFIGLAGGILILIGLVMAMVDVYPGMPAVPSFSQFQGPLLDVLLATGAGFVIMMLLSRFLLKTPLYRGLVSQTASGALSVNRAREEQRTRLGQEGVAVSVLRPGGKAQFGEEILDVVTQGGLVAKGSTVRVIGFSGREPIVEQASPSAG